MTIILIMVISFLLMIITYRTCITKEEYNKYIDDLDGETIVIVLVCSIIFPTAWAIIFVNILRTIGKWFDDKDVLTKIKEALRAK